MLPDEVREAAGVLLFDFQPEFRTPNGPLDFGPAADDALILEKSTDLALAISRDLCRLEAVEGAAKILPFAQNRDPGQARLEAVEDQLFIERPRVEFRHAPFLVVIGDIKRILAGPGTTPCRRAFHRRFAFARFAFARLTGRLAFFAAFFAAGRLAFAVFFARGLVFFP